MLTIPINWEDEYFEKIDFSSVDEVYGKLPVDFIGGGRPSVVFFNLPKRQFIRYLAEVKKRNLRFNYLLNSSCLDNKEFTKNGYREIRKLLDFLSENNIDIVTVILPQLASIIRKYYPQLKISVSTNALVDNFEKVKYWEDEFNVDQITLCHTSVNRNFHELKRIVKYKTHCDIQLICNLFCKQGCAIQGLHGNFQSHASQSTHCNSKFPIDYYCIYCSAKVFLDPSEIMKAGWIRPEDISIYENIGIHKFKLAERGIFTDSLAKIVKAYSERKYEGNFIDLVPSDSKYKYISSRKIGHLAKYFFKPSKVNISKLITIINKLMSLQKNTAYSKSLGFYMDNQKLDGFLDHFIKTACNNHSCNECQYCHKWANNIIQTIPLEDGCSEPKKIFEDILDDLVSEDLYR